ncbi:multidrug efflux SMR transporter [Jiangella sp. DSM 45060]|uniref:DMT family transporter n=1 Tax=Jiangella sp. DSM 45060 TaxID=1798224 RepID=UPI00087DE0F3|nr:multidrug efflux SMR transporter [Jiangella sp. DSM 45060]SDS49605.1 quaternary ammonium compound-resistance protein SugE [Jiangella sp. DSM 45060]
MQLSAWSWLLLAGVIEIAFSQSIKPTDGFTRPAPTLLCVVLGAAAVMALSRAMQAVSVGTAYAVFTGIGAVGAVTLGILISRDPLTPGRLAGLVLIIAGVLVCHVTEPAANGS